MHTEHTPPLDAELLFAGRRLTGARLASVGRSVDMKCGGPGVAGASATGNLIGHVRSSLLLLPVCTSLYLNAR